MRAEAKIERLIGIIKSDNKKIILAFICAALICYLDYSFIMSMQRAAMKSLRSKVSKLEKDTDSLKNNLQDIKNLQTRRKQTLSFAKQIIPEEKLPLLIEKIAQTANKYNVNIVQIRPFKEEKSKDVKTAGIPADSLAYYISLDLFAGYHNIGSFINGLEDFEEFILIRNMKIERRQGDYSKENAELLLKIYVTDSKK